MKRFQRIENLKEFLDLYGKYENEFQNIYKKLCDEIYIESLINSDFSSNHHLNNLRQTKEKEAQAFINSKLKNKSNLFHEFISAFKQDLFDGKLLVNQFPDI